jgi:hypothetical protein
VQLTPSRHAREAHNTFTLPLCACLHCRAWRQQQQAAVHGAAGQCRQHAAGGCAPYTQHRSYPRCSCQLLLCAVTCVHVQDAPVAKAGVGAKGGAAAAEGRKTAPAEGGKTAAAGAAATGAEAEPPAGTVNIVTSWGGGRKSAAPPAAAAAAPPAAAAAAAGAPGEYVRLRLCLKRWHVCVSSLA